VCAPPPAPLGRYAAKEHRECRAAPSDRSTPLTDFFVGAAGVDTPVGAAHPAIANRTYSTELFTRRAADIIRSHDDASPLFVLLSYSAVHKPFLAPPSLLQRTGLAHPARYFKECGWANGSPTRCHAKHRKAYEAMAMGVDDGLRELVDALKGRRMWASTLLVVSAARVVP
jgi:arylsulfatase A-like enzyme